MMMCANRRAIYSGIVEKNGRDAAKCRLTINGRSQFG
jgi:hypothetical protein